jgi:two-component system nitrate/nitrite response regulator NarL
MPEITIAICDTEPVAIEGLRCLFGTAEGLRVVAAENCLAAGIEAAYDLNPAILVLDKSFGMQPVLEALRTLRLAESGLRVVVWGAGISDAEALRLLHAGALGVIRKTASLDILLDCFAAVASGATWMEDGLIRSVDAPVRGGRSPLTARELQVVDLVERGMTNREIGRELGIRTGTVKIHLKHIFEKTGVRGRYGLALSGLKEKGILEMTAEVET